MNEIKMFHKNDNVIEEKQKSSLLSKSFSIKDAVVKLIDESPKAEMMNRIFQNDMPDYTSFNDFEMMYLYINEEKDQDEKKNRSLNSKEEYARELLWTYEVFVKHGALFGLSIPEDGSGLLKLLRDKHIRYYQEWLKSVPLGKGGKPYAIATISRKTVIFKSFLSYLYNRGYIQYPVHKAFLSAKVGKDDRPNRDISRTELIQLLDYYKDHPIMHGFLSVLITTGARVSEIAGVKVSDVSQEDGNYWMEVIGKGNKKRDLLIHENVWETIVRFRQRRGFDTMINPLDHSPLFVTAKGKAYQYKNLSKYITDKINQAEVPFVQVNNELKKQLKEGLLPEEYKDNIRSLTPHTLRHGFAIISVENNSNLYHVSKSLGHESLETTMIYLENKQTKEQNVGHEWKNNDILKHI